MLKGQKTLKGLRIVDTNHQVNLESYEGDVSTVPSNF